MFCEFTCFALVGSLHCYKEILLPGISKYFDFKQNLCRLIFVSLCDILHLFITQFLKLTVKLLTTDVKW